MNTQTQTADQAIQEQAIIISETEGTPMMQEEVNGGSTDSVSLSSDTTDTRPLTTGFLDGIIDFTKATAETYSSSRREDIAKMIIQAAPEIMQRAEAKLVSASTVLTVLREGGQFTGKIPRKANAIGDVLGKHFLNLPKIVHEGKVRYALHMIETSAEDKAACQAALDALSVGELKGLVVG
jgi:hypothetical protein